MQTISIPTPKNVLLSIVIAGNIGPGETQILNATYPNLFTQALLIQYHKHQ
jgi:hypothetical protein